MSFSSLYISGKYASNTSYKIFQAIKPIINLKQLLDPSHIKTLRESVERRAGCRFPSVSLDELNWLAGPVSSLVSHQIRLHKLQEDRTHLKLESKKGPSGTSMVMGKDRYQEMTEEIQSLREKVWDLEDRAMPIVLNLPNLLSDRVPNEEEEEVIKEANLELTKRKTTLAKQLDFRQLSYVNESTYASFVGPDSVYFTGKIAQLHYNLMEAAAEEARKLGYLDFSGLDMVKSAIVEAVRVKSERDFNNDPLRINRGYEGVSQIPHLVGEASLEAFCAFFSKSIKVREAEEVRLVSSGSEYIADPDTKVLTQKNIVRTVSLVPEEDEEKDILPSEREVDDLIDDLWPFYSSLSVPIRCVRLPPPAMMPNEFSRLDIKVFRPSLADWITIGHISNYSDYIPNRIGLPKGSHLVSAVILDTRPLIASYLEVNQLPDGSFPQWKK